MSDLAGSSLVSCNRACILLKEKGIFFTVRVNSYMILPLFYCKVQFGLFSGDYVLIVCLYVALSTKSVKCLVSTL